MNPTDRTAASAFYILSQVADVLRRAVEAGQEFEGDVRTGEDAGRLDGSCEIRIRVGVKSVATVSANAVSASACKGPRGRNPRGRADRFVIVASCALSPA